MKFSNWRKALQNGLSQQNMSVRALARESGLSGSTVHHMVNTEGFMPQINSLLAAFKALDIMVTYEEKSFSDWLDEYLTKRNWQSEITEEEHKSLVKLGESLGRVERLYSFLDGISSMEKLRQLIQAFS